MADSLTYSSICEFWASSPSMSILLSFLSSALASGWLGSWLCSSCWETPSLGDFWGAMASSFILSLVFSKMSGKFYCTRFQNCFWSAIACWYSSDFTWLYSLQLSQHN